MPRGNKNKYSDKQPKAEHSEGVLENKSISKNKAGKRAWTKVTLSTLREALR